MDARGSGEIGIAGMGAAVANAAFTPLASGCANCQLPWTK
jgi:CO/xanthine dehydrogenase Mo-binding subunit